MILPEHRAAKVELELHQEKFHERPELNEEQLMEMRREMGEAIREKQMVTMLVYHQYDPREVAMLPVRIDPVDRKLHGKNAGGKVNVALGNILAVE